MHVVLENYFTHFCGIDFQCTRLLFLFMNTIIQDENVFLFWEKVICFFGLMKYSWTVSIASSDSHEKPWVDMSLN